MSDTDTAGTVIGILIALSVVGFAGYVWFRYYDANAGPGAGRTGNYGALPAQSDSKNVSITVDASDLTTTNPLLANAGLNPNPRSVNQNNKPTGSPRAVAAKSGSTSTRVNASGANVRPLALSPRSARSPLHTSRGIEDDDEHQDKLESQSVFLQGVAKHGYLYKKSTSMKKDWLRRCFFIKDGILYYTHTHTELIDPNANIQAVQVANLMISTVKVVSPTEFHVISPGQRGGDKGGGVYELQADNEEEALAWIQVVRGQIKGALTQTLQPSSSTASGSYRSLDDGNGDESLLMVPSRQLLEDLYQANPQCADCGTDNPDWASLNLCIMVCIECSGIHRSLGVHVSKVRSLTLDKWTPQSAQLLLQVGNERVNAAWEAGLASDTSVNVKPGGHRVSREQRERFIRDKYVDRKYFHVATPNNQPQSQTQLDRRAMKAASTGNATGLLYAIAAGANLSATLLMNDRDTGSTCLHLAAQTDNAVCAELLCHWGAPLDLRDIDGKTALDVASERESSATKDVLTLHYRKS